MGVRKAHISCSKKPALSASSVNGRKLTYILAVNKPVKCKDGRSRIVYIGTTKTGVARIAASVSDKSERALKKHGQSRIEAFVLTCPPRPKVEMWKVLERAAIAAFKREYQQLPEFNTRGKSFKWRDVKRYFQEETLLKRLRTFET